MRSLTGELIPHRKVSRAPLDHLVPLGADGGPLFGELADGRLVQVGIVSYGLGCATPGFPGVYGEVNNPSIHDFITATTGV